MRRADLAKLLISAAKDPERRQLLAQHPRIADRRLADEIRKACYASWTVEPVKAQRAALALRCLTTINGTDDIAATAFWVSGISDITKARFESAIENLNNASRLFAKNGRLTDAAQTQVPKLLALAMLGRYDEAIQTGKNALKVFVKIGDELAAGKIEMNLSNIVSRRSLHHEAERYCLSARRRFIKARENSWKAMAENGLANTYAELNDFKKAEKFYRMALETARAEKMFVTEAEIEASLGNLALLRGRYSEALRSLELSRQKYNELGMPHQSAIADLEIADIYSELNLAVEAAEIYERVTLSFRQLKLTAEEARARLNYGRTAGMLGNYAVSERQLKSALKLFEKEKNSSGEVSASLSLADLAISARQFDKASRFLAKAAKISKNNENPRQHIQLNLLEGELLRNECKFSRAEKKFREAGSLAKKQGQLNAEQGALNSLGQIAVSRRNITEAKACFARSIKIVETLRSSLSAEEFSIAFFAAKLEPFDNLAQLLLSENKVDKAFEILEKGRARSLLDAMAVGNARSSKASGKLHAQMKELRAELNFYYKRIDSSSGADVAKYKNSIAALEATLAKTIRQINSIDPAKTDAGISSADRFNLDNLQEKIGASRTLVEFAEFDGNISAFVITQEQIHYIPSLTTITEVMRLLEELHFQFGSLRYGSIQLKHFLDSLKRRADDCLKNIYDLLLRPLKNYLSGDRLVIIPSGILHYVPFHALHDGERYVIENFETSYAPSAAVWNALQKRSTRKIKTSLLIGHADERIPLVEKEIKEIQAIMPGSKAFTGKQATFDAFVKNASTFDLLHLACHGQFRADNPMFSSLHLADGWITVRDICTQRLDAKLVTLSACETGLNNIFAGEEILGLARGFLTAGAETLIVSLWTVNDQASGHLMRLLYENLQRGLSISASLRKAQLNFVERGEHPYFWSPFVQIGR